MISTKQLLQLTKRLFDFIAAFLGLIVLLPFMAAIAVALKLDGQGGTPIYGGYRVGKNGKLFRCWKFRTMQPGTDHLLDERLEQDPKAAELWDKYHKLPDDPRIVSETARFLRQSSLDELPQLVNVLLGNMSLVGPRPILPEEKELFGDSLNHYLSVRPGISGLWQIRGRNSATFKKRVRWDRHYVENWSFRQDMFILFKTFGVVLDRSNAY